MKNTYSHKKSIKLIFLKKEKEIFKIFRYKWSGLLQASGITDMQKLTRNPSVLAI